MLLAIAIATACGGIITGSPPDTLGDGGDGSSQDANASETHAEAEADRARDAGPADAATDVVADGGDGAADAPEASYECDAAVVYHDWRDPSYWSTFDVKSVNSNVSDDDFHGGAAFDGRYAYLAPSKTGIVVRYDTQAAFTLSSSWSTFDATGVDAKAQAFFGTAFDGRYVYFVPGDASRSVIVRYDTQATFGATSSWASFNLTTVDPNATVFGGAAFDGRYVYLAPADRNAGAANPVAARYDTKAAFTDPSSWSTMSLAPGSSAPVFDGRYLYAPSPISKLASDVFQYDTAAPFTSSSSWSSRGVLNTYSMAFDGRFVYFLGWTWPATGSRRYDTHVGFQGYSAISDWGDAGSGGYCALFDGRYLYLGADLGQIERLDVKAPPCMPSLPGWNGSFF